MANANPFTQSFAALGQSPPTPTVNTFYGTIPQGVSTDVNDLFESLLAFTWRTVSFPVVHFETERAALPGRVARLVRGVRR